MHGCNFVNCCFSDIEAMTKTESEMMNETTRESPLPPIEPVTFQDSTNTSIPLEKISASKDKTTGATVRKPSLVSVSELKLTRYRVAVAFGICCIVMLFLLPIIFFYVEDNSGINIDFDSFIMDIGIVTISQVCIHSYINPQSNISSVNIISWHFLCLHR